eukprot:gene1451-1577_t
MSDSLATEEDYRQVIEISISLLSKQTVPLEQHPPASSSSSYPSGRLTKQERAIIEKSKHFEAEILQTLQQVDKKDDWYLKYKRLAGKLQKEKSQHSVLEDFIQSQNKKITVLVDHVEKLMKALKIESAKRLKIIEESRKNEKEDGALQAKIDRQQRIIATQQRALHEVNEGSKVLEDQLKLMDEKYLELRGKLDVTRDHFMKQIKLVKKENGGQYNSLHANKSKWSRQQKTKVSRNLPGDQESQHATICYLSTNERANSCSCGEKN